MARLVGVLAGLAAGHQFQHPQWQPWRAPLLVLPGGPQPRQGIQRQSPPRRLHGQEGESIDAPARYRLEGGEQRGHGLADAGRRLSQQAAPGRRRLVGALGQLALARAEAVMGKGQADQRGIAFLAMGSLLLGPAQEAFALLFEEGGELGGTRLFGQQRLALVGDVQIDQRQGQRLEPPLGTQQRPVDLDLGPMQGALVSGHPRQVATMGLDLLEAVARRVKAVGPAADDEAAIVPAQRNLAFVAFATPPCHQSMAGDTLAGAGRRREAMIEVALASGEIA